MNKKNENVLARIDKIKIQLGSIESGRKEIAVLYEKVRDALNIPAEITDIDNAITAFHQGVTERISIITERLRLNDEKRKEIEKNRETIKKTGPLGLCPLCWQVIGNHYDSIVREYDLLLEENTAAMEEISLELDTALSDSHRVPALKPITDRIREIQILASYRDEYEIEIAELQEKLEK